MLLFINRRTCLAYIKFEAVGLILFLSQDNFNKMDSDTRTQFDLLLSNIKRVKTVNNQHAREHVKRSVYSLIPITDQVEKPNVFSNIKLFALSDQFGFWERVMAAYMPCAEVSELFPRSLESSAWSYTCGLAFNSHTLLHPEIETAFTEFNIIESSNDSRKAVLRCTCSIRCIHCGWKTSTTNNFDFVLTSFDSQITQELKDDMLITLATELFDRVYTPASNELYLPLKATTNCHIESHIMFGNDTLERCNADAIIFTLHKHGFDNILITDIHEHKPNSQLRIEH